MRRNLTRFEALRAAHGHLLARRFGAALAAAKPWSADPGGALLHALALAGSGAVEAAAPLLARIAAANPGANHPVLDLLPLLPPGQAAAHLRAAVRERPADTRLLTALGTVLADQGPAAEAVEVFRRAATLAPTDPAAWSNLGKAFAAQCAFEEAHGAFATARRLAPSDTRIAYNQGVMLLKAGRFGEGWSALRARHALPGRPTPLPGPRLETLDVAGRTVLLVHDEGFGDTIQFIRYAGPLAERGARVVAAMPGALTRLVATAQGVSEVTTLPSLPAYDLWSPLLDVPALFGPPLESPKPYLSGQTTGATLPAGRKIGIVWAGDPKGLLDPIRSVPVEALAPLRTLADILWVSLQKDGAPPSWMHDPMRKVRDFADTAGIVGQLDAVVAADTAVAHLAAALGKRVLLMDRYDNCWRWLSARDDTPWYPNLEIIRQPTPGDWAAVVDRVAGRLVRA